MLGILAQSIILATKAHATQKRKFTNDSYIYHPLEVARILADWGMSEELQAVGVLHDTIEDTIVVSLDILNATRNVRVANLVAELTKKSYPKDAKPPREERVYEEIKRLIEVSNDAKIVKFADIKSNLSTFDLAYANNPKWAIQFLAEKIATILVLEFEGLPTVIDDEMEALVLKLTDKYREELVHHDAFIRKVITLRDVQETPTKDSAQKKAYPCA